MHEDFEYMHKRNKNFNAQLNYIESLCRELHELSLETDPFLGVVTEKEKDFKAFDALSLVKDICEALAQWAIDHQIGLAYENLSFVPNQPTQTKQHPEYIASLKKVNSHRHEILGAKLRNLESFKTDNYSGKVMRNIIENIMIPNPLFLPESIRYAYLEAFEAANVKSVHPFFNYNAVGHSKQKHKKLELQLKALIHIEFRKGTTNDSITSIRGDIANAYEVDAETIRKWKKPIREELGNIVMDRELAFVQNTISNFLHYKQKKPDKKITTEIINKRFLNINFQYSNEVLRKDGINYQNLELSGKHKKEI